MARLPPGWRRSVCPHCGQEVLIATRESTGDDVRLDPTPRPLFAGLAGAPLLDCYTPHAATCAYR